MPQLIGILLIAGLVLYLLFLYFAGMLWLLANFGPDLLLLTSLTTVGAVVCVFGKALFQTWSRPGWRIAALLPLAGLLTLLYLDIAWLVLVGVAPLRPALGAALEPLIGAAVLRAPLNAWILEFIHRVAPPLPSVMAVAASGVTKLLLTVPLLLLARGTESSVTGGPDPARVQYFHGEAWSDLEAAATLARADVEAMFAWAWALLRQSVGGWWVLATWSLAIALAAGLVGPGFAAVAIGALLFLFTAAANRLVWLLNLAFGRALWLAERAVTLVRSGYAVCPHSRCNERVPRPIFTCPKCGAAHAHLFPDRHGALFHVCTCGERLPTLSWFGKGKLAATCPACNQAMNAPVYRGSIHIPVYGAPAAGKTMLVTANMHRLLATGIPGVRAELIDDRDKREWARSWRPTFERGALREKTVEKFPDALQVSLRRGRGLPVSLYLYDAAGEVLARGEELDEHRFLRVLDGVMFAIDPWSVPALREAMLAAGANEPPRTATKEQLHLQFQSLVNALASQGAIKRNVKSRRRLAITLAKADEPGLRQALGLPAASTLPADWDKAGAEHSEQIQKALRASLPELVLAMEVQFASVRYFAVSAMGRPSSEAGPFRPVGVELPVAWLLSTRAALRHPAMDRLLGGALEVGAVAAAVAPFVVAPWLTWSRWLSPGWERWQDDTRPVVGLFNPDLALGDPEPLRERVRTARRVSSR